MGTKKVTPKNPDAKSSAKAGDKAVSRTTAGACVRHRKSAAMKAGH